MTEFEIQNRLFHDLERKGSWLITPNVFVYDWESDLFALTTRGYAVEYEIKTTLKDFKADFKKLEKHQIMQTGFCIRERTTYEYCKARKTYVEQPAGEKIIKWRPNRFYYVCPAGVIPEKLIPEYAGLIYICGHYFRKIKSAPLLHAKPFRRRWLRKIAVSTGMKYWYYRLNNIRDVGVDSVPAEQSNLIV